MRDLDMTELDLVCGGVLEDDGIETIIITGSRRPGYEFASDTGAAGIRGEGVADRGYDTGGGGGGAGGGTGVDVSVHLDLNQFFDQTKGLLSVNAVQMQLDRNEAKYRSQGLDPSHLNYEYNYHGRNVYTSYSAGETYQRMFMDLDNDRFPDIEVAPAPGGGFSFDIDGDGQADGRI